MKKLGTFDLGTSLLTELQTLFGFCHFFHPCPCSVPDPIQDTTRHVDFMSPCLQWSVMVPQSFFSLNDLDSFEYWSDV